MKKIISLLSVLASLCLSLPLCLAADTLASRSYLYAGSSEIYTHNVDRTKGNLTQVCPDYYEISQTGTLKLTRPVDTVFVSAMHERGIEVTPFVSNHWNRELGRKAMDNRDTFTRQIVEQVTAYGFDGIDIDIENLTHEDRADFTAFMALLRQRLPDRKKLSVCVAANPWTPPMTTGWQGSYDYGALGGIVDEFFIMTYDESYPGSEPGPVSSYGFIKDSVEYAKKLVPAQKIMLGIPFYGRYWVQGKASGGSAFTLADIARITDVYPSVLWYNSDYDCARAQVTVSSQDLEAGLWGNKTLTAGVYDIWYENETSFSKKLGLARALGVKGAGSWALGQEPETIWESYRTWLGGLPFTDIENHWAQGYIVDLYERDLITGYAGRYSPTANMTRVELAALLCRIMEITPLNTPSGFEDTRGHWADGYLSAMRKYNIVSGVTPTEFCPGRAITREEAAVLFEKVLVVPENMDYSESIFPDVSYESNPWSNNAIALLSMYKVINGDQNGYFRPRDLCTRADAAKFAALILELPRKLPDITEPIVEPR